MRSDDAVAAASRLYGVTSYSVGQEERAMREHNSVGLAAGRSGTVFIGSVVALGVTLLSVSSAASAETRGYVISWFATATNNPDFVRNCPQESKDPNRVKYVFGMGLTAEGGRGRYHAVVDGKP